MATLWPRDEFQCLDTALRPNPLVAWLADTGVPEVLTFVHRTNVPALLTGAAQVRMGAPLTPGPRLIVTAAPGVPMASAYVANAIAWREGGDVAVITPSLKSAFVKGVVARVGQQVCGKHGNGPYPIRWEQSDHDAQTAIMKDLELPAVASSAETVERLQRLSPPGFVRDLCDWVTYQIRATGRTQFRSTDIETLIGRQLALRRQRWGHEQHPFVAMTVQQAKNREFAGVIVNLAVSGRRRCGASATNFVQRPYSRAAMVHDHRSKPRDSRSIPVSVNRRLMRCDGLRSRIAAHSPAVGCDRPVSG